MSNYKLSNIEIEYLHDFYPGLSYDQVRNVIHGRISFDVKYAFVTEPAIQDSYEILIDLNTIKDFGLPKVFETKGRILRISRAKGISHHDLHLNDKQGEMCMIIKPKIKERYPNGFVLKEFLHHVEEHLYWISFYEKYNKKPWKEYEHGHKGYVELYIEDKEKYGDKVKAYFGNKPRNEFRRLIREMKKKYHL